MFKIIQSHRTENLVQILLEDYQAKQHNVFEPFIVIVPSMVLGDWLDKRIASQTGISTLVMTKFWGQYQWSMMQSVLSCHNDYLLSQNANAVTLNVPEVAVLSSTVMQWRIFGYFTYHLNSILKDDKHPLNPLLTPHIDNHKEHDHSINTSTINLDNTTTYSASHDAAIKAQLDARLWQLSSDLARVFNRYLTHREDWLRQWSANKILDIKRLIHEKDNLSLQFDRFAQVSPSWLIDHYVELEAAQRFIWTNLFAGVHRHRATLENVFWRSLKENKAQERQQLPNKLRIFTIQQLPQDELDFLQKLSKYMDITLLHYNPSKLFWADIVDKSWLQRQQIINPESVFLRDYGHSLLSRLGKQSRDTFAMLANLAGNESYRDFQVEWQDRFEDESEPDLSNCTQSLNLLQQLQNDVLMLDEQATQQATAVKVIEDIGEQFEPKFSTDNPHWYDDEVLKNKRFQKQRNWALTTHDNSLSIHSCHSLQRQLEVLRIMIGRWLNEPITSANTHEQRHLSDIVVLLPDVERHHSLISSIFVNGKGQDGLTLPAKVTGVVDTSIRQLWEAIIGFYKLLGSESARFEASEVLDWLMLPSLYENFGLTHEQMTRGCELLVEAGFIRGFDEVHLQQTLNDYDSDYRFSFAQALDKLVLGLVMPEAPSSQCMYPLLDSEWSRNNTLPELSLPLSQISLNDAQIVDALCKIYKGLAAQRFAYMQTNTADKWLDKIETHVIHKYFSTVDQTRSMRAIYNAMNGFKSSLRANRHYKKYNFKDIESNSDKADSSIQLEQQLAKVEALPLKLSFMLDSIEAELESQQVSAEPTGVITFGRFGALRNVPFKLVVMLNMNLSEFPARDRDNRYDLMKAATARRGDRVSEDDDNGAFLDALLCARSACWIFYNGLSMTDTHEHLPANPVIELLQFLQGEVQWQLSSLESLPNNVVNIEEVDSVKHQLPKLVQQWLVTQHPALPFDRSLFEVKIEVKSPAVKPLVNQSLENVNSLDDNNTDIHQHRPAHQHQFETDAALQTMMLRTKIAQRQQYPPAKLWQSVFLKLNQRDDLNAKRATAIDLASKEQCAALASLLGENSVHQVKNHSTDTQQLKIAGKGIDLNDDTSYLGALGGFDKNILNNIAKLLNIDTENTVEAIINKLSNTLFDISEIDIEGNLIFQVRHPAKTFLREQMVHILQGEEELAHFEPLSLDGLTRYQISQYLIKEFETKSLTTDVSHTQSIDIKQKAVGINPHPLLYQKIMPAGVARKTTLKIEHQKLLEQYKNFSETLSHLGLKDCLNATFEISTQISLNEIFDPLFQNQQVNHSSVNIHNTATLTAENVRIWRSILPDHIKLKGVVPNQIEHSVLNSINTLDVMDYNYKAKSPQQWLRMLPNSARPEHLLRFWLSHLYWQVARRTTTKQVQHQDGTSIWHFNKSSSGIKKYKNVVVFKLNPIQYEVAAIELIKWSIFAKFSGHVVMTILPIYALQYLEKSQEAVDKGEVYFPKRSDFSSWFNPSYGSDTVYDSCIQHPIWQYLFRDKPSSEPYDALTASLVTLSNTLYQPMFKALEPLSG